MENKFVYREETFNDLAVRELGRVRAKCLCMLQFGRCTKRKCRQCTRNKEFVRCYNELSDYDKLRLASYTNDYYIRYSRSPSHWRTFPRQLAYVLAMLAVICALLGALLFEAVRAPTDKPRDARVIATLRRSQLNVKDYNSDGKLNCIDYTLSFKKEWDKVYPSKDCLIIRNKNPKTGMNHLFIGINYAGDVIYIEPWTADINRYLMEESWGQEYDPSKNNEKESKYWEEFLWQ